MIECKNLAVLTTYLKTVFTGGLKPQSTVYVYHYGIVIRWQQGIMDSLLSRHQTQCALKEMENYFIQHILVFCRNIEKTDVLRLVLMEAGLHKASQWDTSTSLGQLSHCSLLLGRNVLIDLHIVTLCMTCFCKSWVIPPFSDNWNLNVLSVTEEIS